MSDNSNKNKSYDSNMYTYGRAYSSYFSYAYSEYYTYGYSYYNSDASTDNVSSDNSTTDANGPAYYTYSDYNPTGVGNNDEQTYTCNSYGEKREDPDPIYTPGWYGGWYSNYSYYYISYGDSNNTKKSGK